MLPLRWYRSSWEWCRGAGCPGPCWIWDELVLGWEHGRGEFTVSLSRERREA